jgi:hypothetical protein
MSLKDRAISLAKNTALLPLYDFFGGLSEFWFAVLASVTIYLEWRGKLEPNFAVTITALTTILMGHEALDDMHARRMRNGAPDGDPRPNPAGSPSSQP